LFTREAKELGQDFLEKLDNWLSERELEDDKKVERRLLDPVTREEARVVKVGVGVYLYEHWGEKGQEMRVGVLSDEGK